MKIRLFTRRPTLRQLPLAVLKVALVGAVLGPACSLIIAWLTSEPWDRMFAHPWLWLGSSCLIGAIFGSSFYVTCGLPFDYLRPLLRSFPPPVARLVILATAMAGGALGCIVSLYSVQQVFHARFDIPLGLGKLAMVDGILAAIISLVISAFTKLQTEKQLRERTLSEAAAKAQAFALQAQINPHFFFNTLNTISALIPIDPRAAQATIGQLADMFRYTLSCSRAELVSLEDEVNFAKNYLLLEQARFGNRLRVEMPEAGEQAGVALPGLTLQPIVENAVRYGVAKRVDGGTVRLEIARSNGQCRLSILNQYDKSEAPKLDPTTLFRNGHALANIRERLNLMFGARAGLDIALAGYEWVRVTVSVPVGDTPA
jgi:hypothetical protein